MNFYFFTKGGKNTPSSRYRAYYLAEALVDLGHEASVTPATDHSIVGFFRYLRRLLSARPGEVIFLQRTIYNRFFILAVFIAWLLGRRFIFDIDDAVFLEPARRVKFLTYLSDRITYGSEFVLEWARTRNRPTTYLPNSVPLAIYTKRTVEPLPLTIGWIGTGPGQIENLSILPPVLKKLSARGIDFRFILVGAMGDARIHEMFGPSCGFKADIIDSLNWEDPSEAVREIKRFSVGTMPLTPEQWNQAKHFKALEYMACGIPVVGSSARALREILTSARCGFLAENDEEWVEHLTRLLGDPALRRSEGEKGRAVVEQKYSTKAMAQTLITAVESA
jgi:glycosyltransferase involved in cell wall biosynthesis